MFYTCADCLLLSSVVRSNLFFSCFSVMFCCFVRFGCEAADQLNSKQPFILAEEEQKALQRRVKKSASLKYKTVQKPPQASSSANSESQGKRGDVGKRGKTYTRKKSKNRRATQFQSTCHSAGENDLTLADSGQRLA